MARLVRFRQRLHRQHGLPRPGWRVLGAETRASHHRLSAEEIRDGTDERYPTGSRLRWDFPARGDMPAVKVYWYEGLRKDFQGDATGGLRQAKGDAQNLPPLLLELKKQYPDEEFDTNGTLYVGEKGSSTPHLWRTHAFAADGKNAKPHRPAEIPAQAKEHHDGFPGRMPRGEKKKLPPPSTTAPV